ncbi:MAG: M23 family metallopeptidase [Oscillospiraceae bacterium]|nr:M23 family metallopeptidase [Oscillospiraceae bacterium]
MLNELNEKGNFIKYAKFSVNYEALNKAFQLDINSQNLKNKLNFIDMLAYLGAMYGGKFEGSYKSKDLENLAKKLQEGESIEKLTKNMKFFPYYKEVYSAVLGEFIGKYKVQVKNKISENDVAFEEKYGLKVFFPIAKTFSCSHYRDFGASRSFGYQRPHLGHDITAGIGTPVIAVESGKVECVGWNKYGGWRIGIRSFDKKRYYYYAHLRKNKPYHPKIKEGELIKAGDVIGYVGRTGYSEKENVNNIETSHLHLGIQLIFDESQKESDNEIWIDLYAITEFLKKNKSEVYKDKKTKEYYRKYDFSEKYFEEQN